VRTIDPFAPVADAAEAAARARVSRLVFEPLAAVDAGGLHPALATSWQQDARTGRWRFQLRSGVALHDGGVLEAWQAAASLRLSEPAWKVSVDGDIVLVDPDVPTPDLPWAIADERHAIVVRGGGGSLVGTGPFRLDRIESARVVLRAHDDYWRARPFADAVQIDTGRALDAQLMDLESGRADVVSVRPTDSRRAARRGLRLDASNPLELVALIVEQHRASDAWLPWRRALAATLDRDAICDVVLQGRAVPARSVLPEWLSAYAPVVALPHSAALTPAAVAALPSDMRETTIRVERGDPVTRAIGERIAVDAREAGISIDLQAPAGLAPRADARLVRVRLTPTTPDRALVSAASRLTVRGWPPLLVVDSPALKDTWAAEQALLAQAIVVPVVHVPELYALGERVGFSAQPAANPTGGWNLADMWVRGKP
jgi:MarR-like DNA-binding transcriptional regulator SgrR of sgrS sRNA